MKKVIILLCIVMLTIMGLASFKSESNSGGNANDHLIAQVKGEGGKVANGGGTKKQD